MNTPILTYGQARLTVLNLCEDFLAGQVDSNAETYYQALCKLEHRINYYLGEDRISCSLLNEVIEGLRQLSLLDTGDHESLIHTANGAIDEGGQIRTNLNGQLKTDLHLLVTDAGFDRGLVAA